MAAMSDDSTLGNVAGHRTWSEIRDERPLDDDTMGRAKHLFDVLTRMTLAVDAGEALTVQPEEAKALLIALEG
jgi:hypothetical protein